MRRKLSSGLAEPFPLVGRFGNRVRYRKPDLDAWAARRRATTTAEADRLAYGPGEELPLLLRGEARDREAERRAGRAGERPLHPGAVPGQTAVRI